jgi:acetyltransferase-like isoleucine patch superfamily enzyme
MMPDSHMRLLKNWSNFLFEKLFARKVERCVKNQLLNHYLVFGAPKRLKIAASAVVHNALFNTMSGSISIEEDVCFGHSVSVITGTHDADAVGEKRRNFPTSGRDITIKRGAWIASNSTILGPCVIGEDAVVATCSLVRNDVPPRTIVAGVPAKTIRTIRDLPGDDPV